MGQIQASVTGGLLKHGSRAVISRWQAAVVVMLVVIAAGATLAIGIANTGTPESVIRQGPSLTLADDFGTRHFGSASAPVLGPADDFGTRHFGSASAPVLGPADDFGTRHAPATRELTERDDYGTRNAGR
jgi:hypothetical protein